MKKAVQWGLNKEGIQSQGINGKNGFSGGYGGAGGTLSIDGETKRSDTDKLLIEKYGSKTKEEKNG